jgi:hypothetical protein
MAHGSGPRASRPHQFAKTASRWRRRALEYQQTVRVQFVDGKATEADVTDATRWATRADRLTGRV